MRLQDFTFEEKIPERVVRFKTLIQPCRGLGFSCPDKALTLTVKPTLGSLIASVFTVSLLPALLVIFIRARVP